MPKVKILQLNAWTGRIKDGLSRFIADGDYDIVCLQEAIWSEKGSDFLELYLDTVDKIKHLGDFPYDFRSSNYGVSIFGGEAQVEQGNVILSKIPFKNTNEITVYGQYSIADTLSTSSATINKHCYTAQKVQLENGLTLANYHGYYLTNPIGDETTIECMHNVAEMLKKVTSPVVMCGDLNVISESPAMRELDFLSDLTAQNQVKTTLRNIRFVEDVPCDHILVSNDIKYENFQVINAPVSDHRALTVEINI
ncbi:MAG: endonuclease/exonuclease/phosphatase family protein [Candidatus Saccharibacteria bacterium]|nr:endonuclease/exonuclease/phosphatase family protein [Candidatus Saccharibacteria bacterium]